MKKSQCIAIMLCLNYLLNAQELTQTIRGKVVDKDTQIPLIGATIMRLGSNVNNGTITDINGDFSLNNVPVGRHDFRLNYIGYEPFVINELLVNSGKEVVLNIELTESVTQLEEIVVKPNTRKDMPLNDMTSVSARVFSIEEAKRYAGGFDDPTRLASSFAGVAATDVESNGISVRGNAPSMVQYRMEGVEIENANHFEGGDLLGGGFISIFNSHLLANSDFLTGAFPAEYGNALSAAFDMNLRIGNTQKYEHAFQVGIMGIDVASEGPINKGSNSSYLFNYRYSTFGLLQNLLPEGEGLPVYQDLCFKINLPTKIGVFSIWGAGAKDNYYAKATNDSTDWNMEDKRMELDVNFLPLLGGISHKYILKNRAYINSTVVYSYYNRNEEARWMHNDLQLYDIGNMDRTINSFTFSTFLNKKYNKHHTNRTGVSCKIIDYQYDERIALERLEPLQNTNNAKGNSALLQAYTQSKVAFSSNLVFNVGLHYQMLSLNNKYTIEPRIGMKYKLSERMSFSGAYGLHSRMQVLNHYFVNDVEEEMNDMPNKDIDFTKAQHFVLGFDYKITKNTRLKIEPYYQLLSNIPVIPDSSFAVINLQDSHVFYDAMVNDGTGTNMGIEFTLERFLDRGIYYLVTASVYDSKYVGGDGVERNTIYNGNFVANVLGGKEWNVGKSKNNLFGINGRLYVVGGNRQGLVDKEESFIQKKVVFDNNTLFEDRKPTTTRLDVTLSFTRNRPNHTSTVSVQILNVLGTVISYKQEYDFVKDKVVEMEGRSVLPNISWKIEF